MKISDITDINTEEDFLNDDLIFFMNNDPAFYRKIFFPAILDIRNKLTKVSENELLTIISDTVKKACYMYKDKFNIDDKMKNLFTLEDIRSISHQLLSQIRQDIKDGHYDP